MPTSRTLRVGLVLAALAAATGCAAQDQASSTATVTVTAPAPSSVSATADPGTTASPAPAGASTSAASPAPAGSTTATPSSPRGGTQVRFPDAISGWTLVETSTQDGWQVAGYSRDGETMQAHATDPGRMGAPQAAQQLSGGQRLQRDGIPCASSPRRAACAQHSHGLLLAVSSSSMTADQIDPLVRSLARSVRRG